MEVIASTTKPGRQQEEEAPTESIGAESEDTDSKGDEDLSAFQVSS